MEARKRPRLPSGRAVISERRELRLVTRGARVDQGAGEWQLDRENRKESPIELPSYSIPYGVETGPLLAQIGEIVASRKMPQAFSDSPIIRDEAKGLRIVLKSQGSPIPKR